MWETTLPPEVHIAATMSRKHFAPLPQDATLSFGGYSIVSPQAWKIYLDKVIQEDYPDYFAENLQGRWNGDQWRVQESCILIALESYLFHEFGICIPGENLFKVFNKEGEGLELPDMMEAISAVVEPLGLEIDRVFALDPEIKAALGENDRMIDEKQSDLLDGRPGLCMINVEDGYSHAFYWRKIDPRGFKHEKFRFVVLIRRIVEEEGVRRSPVLSLRAFLDYFLNAITEKRSSSHSKIAFLENIRPEIQVLERACSGASESEGDPDTSAKVDQLLASLLASYQGWIAEESLNDRRTRERSWIVIEAGQMVRKAIRESAKEH
jgi:hypothetical protein